MSKYNINILITIAYKTNEMGSSQQVKSAPIVRRVKRKLLNGMFEDSAGEVWEAAQNTDKKFPQALLKAVA